MSEECQALYKQFYRNFPKYLRGKKVLFPIMDECLVQYSGLFPQSKHSGKHPEGKALTVFTTVAANTLLEIVTFLNSFPRAHQFNMLSDCTNIGSQFHTPFLRIVNQLDLESHSIQSFGKINLYSNLEAQEQLDRVNFRLISFVIEDLFKYKMNLIQPKDILKQRIVETEIKKEKKEKKTRASLLSIVEKQQQNDVQPEDEKKEQLLEQLQFENYLDGTCSIFWNIVYEMFSIINKKLIKQQQQQQQQQQNKQEFDVQESKIQTKCPIDSFNIGLRRKQYCRNYTNIKLKEQTKSQNKSIQQIKNMKYIDAIQISQSEQQKFNRLSLCFSRSWAELLLQAIKIPYVRSLFQDTSIISKLKEDKDGYFKYTTKERAQLTQLLIEGCIDTESLRQTIEYRQEMIHGISEELEEIAKVFDELNQTIKLNGDKEQQQLQTHYRKVYKKYLQLVEFPRLFINGSQYLGQDVKGTEYYIFSFDTLHLYSKLNNDWFQLSYTDIQQLNQVLNIHGVKERELQSNLQKLLACELLGDQDTSEILKGPPPQDGKQTQIIKSTKALIQKILRETESKMTRILCTKHQRWEHPRVRTSFFETIDSCEDMTQLAKLVIMLTQQFEKVQMLKFNPYKLSEASFSEQELNNIERVLTEKLDEQAVFDNFNTFLLMEREQVVTFTGNQSKTQFWGYSVGDKVRNLLIQYSEKLEQDDYYGVLFIANVINFAVEEYAVSQGETIEPEINTTLIVDDI